MSTTTTSTTQSTYELHTFIFPPTKPYRNNVPKYFFPIAPKIAYEFLHPTSAPTAPSKPGPECWPFHLLNHPEWVVATILRFTDAMRDSSWKVAGMKFVDEEEEERERVMRETERRSLWERQREKEAGSTGRAFHYGGVYYGNWYGQEERVSGNSKAGVNYSGGRRRGELKCQILLVQES